MMTNALQITPPRKKRRPICKFSISTSRSTCINLLKRSINRRSVPSSEILIAFFNAIRPTSTKIAVPSLSISIEKSIGSFLSLLPFFLSLLSLSVLSFSLSLLSFSLSPFFLSLSPCFLSLFPFFLSSFFARFHAHRCTLDARQSGETDGCQGSPPRERSVSAINVSTWYSYSSNTRPR